MGKTALIAVDVQNDFLPEGALGFSGSDSIIETLLEYATVAADVVIASRNLYPPDHESFTIWPSHCVKGTKGAAVVADIAKVANYVITKGQTKQEGGFSAFEGGTLRPLESLEDILLREKVTHIMVGGYWAEYTVANTAFDANALSYSTVVLKDATVAYEARNWPSITERLARAGIVVVS